MKSEKRGLALTLALIAPLGLAAVLGLGSTRALAQDAPPAPGSQGTPGGVQAPPASTGEAPAPAPTPAPTKPADAAKDDSSDEGLWLGSKPGQTVEAGVLLYLADFKGRSHFGFAEHNGRGEETAFVEDAGWPKTVLMEGASLKLDLGIFGWVGGDVLGFAVNDQQGLETRERQTNGTFFENGDTLHSHGQILWGKVYYGYEFGYRLTLGPVPLAFMGSPYLGVGVIDEDVRIRRSAPNPTGELGGHITSFYFTPNLRGYIDIFDHAKIGFDVGIPGGFALNTPTVHTNDRYAVYGGVHAFHVELDVGWEEIGNHLLGLDRATDMRFRGYFFQLRAEF